MSRFCSLVSDGLGTGTCFCLPPRYGSSHSAQQQFARQVKVSLGTTGLGVVRDHGKTMAGSFCNADVAGNGCLVDLVAEERS